MASHKVFDCFKSKFFSLLDIYAQPKIWLKSKSFNKKQTLFVLEKKILLATFLSIPMRLVRFSLLPRQMSSETDMTFFNWFSPGEGFLHDSIQHARWPWSTRLHFKQPYHIINYSMLVHVENNPKEFIFQQNPDSQPTYAASQFAQFGRTVNQTALSAVSVAWCSL